MFPQLTEDDEETYKQILEKLFCYCLVWSIGGTVEESSRREIDYVLRDIESIFPSSNTIYEHYISEEKRDWQAWEEKLQSTYTPSQKDLQFH